MHQAQKEISLAWLLQQRIRNGRTKGRVENRWDVESEKLCRVRKEEDVFDSISLFSLRLASPWLSARTLQVYQAIYSKINSSGSQFDALKIASHISRARCITKTNFGYAPFTFSEVSVQQSNHSTRIKCEWNISISQIIISDSRKQHHLQANHRQCA